MVRQYEFQVSRQDAVKTCKEIQNCREVKCAKLRGSERSRFAIADDIFENEFFPVVKISKEKLFCCFFGFWPVLA